MKLRKTILVITKEGPLRRLLRGVSADFALLAAADGVDGIRTYERHSERVSAVVTELDAPRLGGDLVADWIHRTNPELPIFITGDAEDATLDDLLCDPKVRFVARPRDRRQLVSLLFEAVETEFRIT